MPKKYIYIETGIRIDPESIVPRESFEGDDATDQEIGSLVEKWHKATFNDTETADYDIFVTLSDKNSMTLNIAAARNSDFFNDWMEDDGTIRFEAGAYGIEGKKENFAIDFSVDKEFTTEAYFLTSTGERSLESDVGIGRSRERREEESSSSGSTSKSEAKEDIPIGRTIVTLKVMGVKLTSRGSIKIRVGNDGEGGPELQLENEPSDDKTSALIPIRIEDSNWPFFSGRRGRRVNVAVTGTSLATGGPMTITKDFVVPSKFDLESQYLLVFNFSEGALRQKDATSGLKSEFGARRAIDFTGQTGTVQYIYYTNEGYLKADMVETTVNALGRKYEFFFNNEPLLVPVRISSSLITRTKKETRKTRGKLINEALGAEEHWILLLGKERPGAGASSPGGDTDDADTSAGRGGEGAMVNANIALKYLRFTTKENYVILPNFNLDIEKFAFELAESADGAPGDRNEETLVEGEVDKGAIGKTLSQVLFKSSDAYKQMSGQFSDDLSPAAQRGIVKCWVEGPTVTGNRGVTAREESRARG